jgi:hypothetical protein
MIHRLGVFAALAAALSLALAAGSAVAGDKKSASASSSSSKPKPSIGGKVIGENGKPQEGAEIRALRVDAKAPVITAWTDSTGRYAFANLPVGTYSVTAVVDTVPLSRANVETRKNGWVKLDFDLQHQLVQGMSRELTEDIVRNFIPNTNPH